MQDKPQFKIPLNETTFGEAEIQAAIDVIRSDRLTFGPKCLEFEAAFAQYVGVKNAIMVNSGSSANLLGMFALVNPQCPSHPPKRRLLPGDEVIVPALTWSTTIWPIVQAGLTPVFVDADLDSLQMSVSGIENAISSRTAAICAVHILGNAMEMDALLDVVRRHNLWLFEDTCESLGVSWKDKFVGTYGDVGTFSFYFSHHISTIEGGMVTTDNDDLADLMRAMRSHGWSRQMKSRAAVEAQHADIDPQFLFVSSGFNLRPTEINAAIGLIQLDKLSALNDRRCVVWDLILEGLDEIIVQGHLRVPQYSSEAGVAPFGFPVVCRSKDVRHALSLHLNAHGIETRPVICGNMVRQPGLRGFEFRVSGELTGADKVMDCGLYWAAHPKMTQDQIDYLVSTVQAFFSK